jgi:hypothetical protein
MSITARVPLQLPLLPASDFCQRWREQRVVWRHRHAAGETFVPRGYEVAPIGRPQTADFLRDHHYLHKLPANRFRFGLLRGADLVGIAVLGPGMPHPPRAVPRPRAANDVLSNRYNRCMSRESATTASVLTAYSDVVIPVGQSHPA